MTLAHFIAWYLTTPGKKVKQQKSAFRECSSLTGSEYVPIYWSFKSTDSEGFPVCFKNGNTNERAEGQVSANWRWSEDFNDKAFSSRFYFNTNFESLLEAMY